jgi:hypothetical protein
MLDLSCHVNYFVALRSVQLDDLSQGADLIEPNDHF